MSEPCKKKPRKSKLVPCTYQDLQAELKKQDTPPENLKFSVNVEVEECEDDWLQKMLEDEKKQKSVRGASVRGVKSQGKKVKSKEKRAKDGQSSDIPNDEEIPGPSDAVPEKLTEKEEMSTENQVEVKIEEPPAHLAIIEGSGEDSSHSGTQEAKSLEEELPAFQISKPSTESEQKVKVECPIKLPEQPVVKKREKRPRFNLKRESLALHLAESEHHYAAVDKTVVFCTDTISNYYHSVIEDAIVLSPYTSNSSYKRKIANISKYICNSCNFESTSQKYLENHLEEEHYRKDVYIYVKPNTLVASKSMPRDECFLADVHLGHMVYYCTDYQEAIWTLVSKWNLTVNADQRRKPGVLSYKCYYCRFQYEHYTEFLMHLNDFHKQKKIVITSEFLAPSHMNIAAGGNILTTNLNIKGPDGYQCYKCKKKLSSVLLLEQHNKHNIPCDGCEVPFPCDELQTHQGYCEKYLNSYFPKMCPCKKVFHTYQQQNMHRSICKFGKATIAYTCTVCSYMAPSLYLLCQHQHAEHHARSDVFADVKVRKCDKCKSKFVDSDYHVCEDSAGADCYYCGLNFYNIKFLELHQKVYGGKQECNQCGHEFAKGCQLIEHNARNHDGIYKILYQCPICKVEFDSEEQNRDDAHSQEIHEKATWGGVRMKLRKIHVLKDPKSLALNTNADDDGETVQKIQEHRPTQNESDAKDSEIIIRSINTQKQAKQMKVYGSQIPKELEKVIKTIKIGVPKRNPAGLQVKVRSASELKALENSHFLPTIQKKENRSLLKNNISDKIVFEDGNVCEAIDNRKHSNHKRKSETKKNNSNELNTSDIVTVSSIKADFVVSKPDKDFKINEILMCISKNTRMDTPQIVSYDEDVDMISCEITNANEANAQKPEKSIEKSKKSIENMKESTEKVKESPENVKESPEKVKELPEKVQESNEKVKESPEKVKESIKNVKESPEKVKESPEKVQESNEQVKESSEKVKESTEKVEETIKNEKDNSEFGELVTIKQEIDVDNDEHMSHENDINTQNICETFEMAKDIPKKEPDITDNLISSENIKKEVIDIMTNIKNEDPGEGCSYTEVSLSNVFQISKHMLETNVEIKAEPDEYEMTFEDNLLQPVTEKNVVCKCGYTGTNKEYKQHKNVCQEHQRKNLCYKCLQCDLQCQDLRDYLKHLYRHGYKKFQCPSCHIIQQNNQKFAEHVLQHIKSGFRKITFLDKTDKNQTKKFRCNLCRSIFAQTDFFLHWQTHFTSESIEKINETSKTQSISDPEKCEMIDFILDPKKTKERKCLKCDHTFARHNDLKRHYIEHLLSHAYTTKTVYKELRCQICSHGFENCDLYKKHMRDHALLPLYQCQICDKAFSDSSNFGKHKKVHDLHTSVCDICNKKFQCKLMLKKHMEAHSKSKPIECEQCQKVFYFETAYRKHYKLAHGDVTYGCKICKQRFDSIKMKWEHEWEIHQERKFNADCPICNKGFRNYAATKSHMKAEHGVDVANVLIKKFFNAVGNKKK